MWWCKGWQSCFSGGEWAVCLRGVRGVPREGGDGGLPHLRIPTLPSPWQAHPCPPGGTHASLVHTLMGTRKHPLNTFVWSIWSNAPSWGRHKDMRMSRSTRWSVLFCWTLVCSWRPETGRRTWRSSTLPLPPSGGTKLKKKRNNSQVPPCLGGRRGSCSACAKWDGWWEAGHRAGGRLSQHHHGEGALAKAEC